MSDVKILAPPVPNMPWQEKPDHLNGAPVWRYHGNPIIPRNPAKEVARIFNSAVIPYEDGFIGVFRGQLEIRRGEDRIRRRGRESIYAKVCV